VYEDRAVFGWAALVLALLATGAPVLARTRPGVAGAIMIVEGLLGLGAILLFYINTWYALAVPCWIVAAALLFTENRREAQP
jgi:type IV secretory pathway TrbD component